jgi:diguanylate cyclase (GGDEF)-like protein
MQALTAGDFQVLVAEESLPPPGGRWLLSWASRHCPSTAGVLLAGSDGVGPAAQAVGRGEAFACVLQPARRRDLLRAVRDAARQSRRQQRQAAAAAASRANLGLRVALLQSLLRDPARRLRHEVSGLERDNRALRRRLVELERLALTDPLTGLPNRRAIEEAGEHEVRRRARHPGALAVGLLDADHFKEVNTRHLHCGGDQALVGLAGALSAALRGSDRLGRVSGEEFLVVAPQTDLSGAEALAERLRSAVEQARISYRGVAIPLTISLGFAVAGVDEPAEYPALRHAAAEALARAKADGRNRAVVRPLTAPA